MLFYFIFIVILYFLDMIIFILWMIEEIIDYLLNNGNLKDD